MMSSIALLSMVCVDGIDWAFVPTAILYLQEHHPQCLQIPQCARPHHDRSTSTSLSDKEAQHIPVLPSKSPSAPPRMSTNVTPSSSPTLATKSQNYRTSSRASLPARLWQIVTTHCHHIKHPSISPSKSPEQSRNVMIKKTNLNWETLIN